ncbi:MAG: GNAT family N-acetyltransferase [Clostridiales bacterium]|nr:GNAT family N-acetyltransferase [Clostridiales bacterium]
MAERFLRGLTLRESPPVYDTPADVFSRLPVLDTPRLTLRPMTMRDAQDIYDYSCDREVARHVLWDAHRSLADSRAYLRYILRQYREGVPSSYGIVLKETGRLIGTIGFMWMNMENSTVEVGYSLAREQWNKGLMTEALRALIDMAFTHLPLHRIEAQHATANPSSGRVMIKCGMKKEGTLRGRIYNKGKFVDVDLYAILKEDWDQHGAAHR